MKTPEGRAEMPGMSQGKGGLQAALCGGTGNTHQARRRPVGWEHGQLFQDPLACRQPHSPSSRSTPSSSQRTRCVQQVLRDRAQGQRP